MATTRRILYDRKIVNGWQIKERQRYRQLRLPRYTVWLDARCYEEFRQLRAAVKWCEQNSTAYHQATRA